MAGNQTDARIRAERALNEAVKNGANPKTISTLRSDWDAAKAVEKKEMSKGGPGFFRQ